MLLFLNSLPLPPFFNVLAYFISIIIIQDFHDKSLNYELLLNCYNINCIKISYPIGIPSQFTSYSFSRCCTRFLSIVCVWIIWNGFLIFQVYLNISLALHSLLFYLRVHECFGSVYYHGCVVVTNSKIKEAYQIP